MTSVSMRTSPKMSRKRICGPPRGFLEIPSHAALMALAWQNAPMNTARVMIPAPSMRDNLKRESLAALLEAVWASRGAPARAKKNSASPNVFVVLDILVLLNGLMFTFMRDGSRDVNAGEKDKDERLDQGGKDRHDHKRQGT